jgi:hypothetical protein
MANKKTTMTADQERVLKDLEFANKPKFNKDAQGVTIARSLTGFEQAAPYLNKELQANRNFNQSKGTPAAKKTEAKAQALRGMLNQRRKLGGQ